jgi:hypothetical protein
MTTSFAHLMRGHLVEAVRSNVGGTVLALACAAQVPWCWWSAFSGRLVGVSHPTKSLLALLSLVIAISAVDWLYRIFGG